LRRGQSIATRRGKPSRGPEDRGPKRTKTVPEPKCFAAATKGGTAEGWHDKGEGTLSTRINNIKQVIVVTHAAGLV